jgi:hypothetical protein
MSKLTRLIVAGLLIAFAFFGESILQTVRDMNGPEESIVINVVEPNSEWKNKVQKIAELNIVREDASKISNFYNECADVVQYDPGFIESTSIFRDFNVTAGGLNFAGTEMKDKYPQLGELIDECIAVSIGLDNIKLTKEIREELVKCLRAIAWAVHQ